MLKGFRNMLRCGPFLGVQIGDSTNNFNRLEIAGDVMWMYFLGSSYELSSERDNEAL